MLRRFLLRVIFSLSATATSLLAQAPAVTIDGSSTVYPITKLAGEAFEQETKGDVKVNVAFSGTTGGFASSSKEKSTSPMRPAQF
jgi:phosphate transport system substrate-binding protein